jgi:DNA end-binding protein Ku
MADEEEVDFDEATRSTKPIWSGTLSFGLVSIPVMLVPAVRPGGVPLHMLDEDGAPLKRRYMCPAHGREIHPEHIIRGYETDDGSYVPVSQEELQKLEPEKSRDINLTLFADLEEVDPMYFERSYYLLPTGSSNKAYRLLVDAMESTGKAGIARFVMRDKEYLVTIIAEGGLLRAETMRFHDEIRTPEDVGLDNEIKPSAAKVSAMSKAIKSMTKSSLSGADLTDHSTERLLKLITSKAAKRQDVVETAVVDTDAEPDGQADLKDLMASISASVAAAKKRASRPGARDEPEVEAAGVRRKVDRHGRGDSRIDRSPDKSKRASGRSKRSRARR